MNEADLRALLGDGGTLVSVGAMGARLVSRITVFTGGRNVEYELRRALLAHLHKLGPSFFATHPTGEIMSRATNDIAAVRQVAGPAYMYLVNTIAGGAFAKDESDYGGETVHAAARIGALAGAGEILASAETLRHARGHRRE